MITLTAEVVCDSCGKVCGVGEPVRHQPRHGLNSSSYEAMLSAELRARSHGAQINVATTLCRECLDKHNAYETQRRLGLTKEGATTT